MAKIIKVLKRKTQDKNFMTLVCLPSFLAYDPKAQATKEKTVKLDFINIKSFGHQGHIKQSTMWPIMEMFTNHIYKN